MPSKRLKSFRLSELAISNLGDYAKTEKTTPPNALNRLLEKMSNKQEPTGERDTGELFFVYPSYLYCDAERRFMTKETLLDPTSKAGCKDCSGREDKTCPAWKK